MNPVLHRTAQPIALHEFSDALRAAAPPRFPHGRSVWHRRVGLAVSGGVDSMALAYLCAQLRRSNPFMRVSDAPTGGFSALIIDHGLREGSAAEATAVARAVTKLGHRAQVWPLRWPAAAAAGSPAGLTSSPTAMETNARRLRYRCLGLRLSQLKIVSLLLAHHEDDQYETVLMRLLSGYGLNGGIRGLRGMRAAADLPECQGMYGAHQSGFLDDQRDPSPYVLMRPSRQQRRRIKSAFRDDMIMASVLTTNSAAAEMEDGGGDWDWHWTHLHQLLGQSAPPLAPLDTEDLGIVAYRPLLPFAKDRLVATCLANDVPWFEDHTNADPTLTLRNALRHVVRDQHTLPTALQKPAILQLAARCDAKSRQHEAEARRLVLRHGVVVRFTANVGTIVARLPRLRVRARPRPWKHSASSPSSSSSSSSSSYYDTASAEIRRRHLRTVAALVVQNLLGFVTPETNVTPVSQLQGVVDTLFPDLVGPAAVVPDGDPKAFIICGVHFMPVVDKSSPASSLMTPKTTPKPTSSSWYLARAPYVSAERATPTAPTVPAIRFQSLSLAHRWKKQPAQWNWSTWSRWNLYDGRFWVRIRTRLPVNVSLQPFDKQHSKEFREALGSAQPSATPPGASPRTTSPRLSAFLATLKTYAPGKVRYTLPAIYVSGDISWALEGRAYWPEDVPAEEVPVAAASDLDATGLDAAGQDAAGLDAAGLDASNSGASNLDDGDTDIDTDIDTSQPPICRVTGNRQADLFRWERDLRRYEQAQWSDPNRPVMRLLALPTLGAHIPGIERWLQWEVRYRKVDTAVLESSHEAALERAYSYAKGWR